MSPALLGWESKEYYELNLFKSKGEENHFAMAEVSQEVLLGLVNEGPIENSRLLCQERSWDHETFVGILKSLESKEMLRLTKQTAEVSVLSAEGKTIARDGSPEYRVFLQVAKDGTPKAEVEVRLSQRP